MSHDSWITMMLNFFIIKFCKHVIMIMFLLLCTLYWRINSFRLTHVILKSIKREFMTIVKRFCLRHFFKIDFVIWRCHVFAWFFWSLMSRFVSWLLWKDKEANDLISSLNTRRWKMIWLFNWWRDHISKCFWLVDELHNVRVRENFAEWS